MRDQNPNTTGLRLPPQNIEAEEGVIGSVLLDNGVIHDVVSKLKVEDFYRDTHQIMYRAIRDLYDQGQPIDGLTLSNELGRRNEFHLIGHDGLSGILERVPHAANAIYYADIVREKSIGRRLIDDANEILRESYSGNYTADELVNSAQAKVMAISEGRSSSQLATLEDSIDEAMELIDRRQSGEVTGLGSGYPDLDMLTCGWQPESFNILAARPSMGKSCIAGNIAEYAAIELVSPTLFVSLEMTRTQLIQRMICGRARIDAHRISTGLPRLNPYERGKLLTARNELASPNLIIDETASQDALQITATVRGIMRRQPLGLIVVDYIQILAAENDRDSRQEQVAKMSRRLKALARETGVPVLALSQLNRDVEKREDNRPRMADLKESGALEQDADVVMLLHRPEYYDANDQPGIAELIVAKNRHGATGTARLCFQGQFSRFESMARPSQVA